MKKILVTGGTVFVSRYVAEYYAAKGYEVYVLNRNTKPQPADTHLIEADRHQLGDKLKQLYFDVVIDVTAYHKQDIEDLLDGLGDFGQYIMISSSAVYPETEPQPFKEEGALGKNCYWGTYGTDKIAAEEALLKRVPDAYILRPPYLYGSMNNVYREAFVFDCALADRQFYLPKDGSMKLQFFHVKDLCKFIDRITEMSPDNHIFNVGNRTSVTVKEWAELCYLAAGKKPEFVNVYKDIEQRNYFSFYDYEYFLDVEKQYAIMPETIPLEEGIKESYEWYCVNRNAVRRKPFIEYIDKELKGENHV